MMSNEHGIDATGAYIGTSDVQLERLSMYYNEVSSCKYFPCTILLNLEKGTMDYIQSGPYDQLFRLDNFVLSQSRARKKWAKGHYMERKELVDPCWML